MNIWGAKIIKLYYFWIQTQNNCYSYDMITWRSTWWKLAQAHLVRSRFGISCHQAQIIWCHGLSLNRSKEIYNNYLEHVRKVGNKTEILSHIISQQRWVLGKKVILWSKKYKLLLVLKAIETKEEWHFNIPVSNP